MTRFERNLGAAVSAYNRVARRRGTRELTADDVAHIKTRAQLGVFFATHDPGPPQFTGKLRRRRGIIDRLLHH